MNDTLMPFIPQDAALLYTGIAELIYAIALLVFYRSKLLVYPAMVFPVIATVLLYLNLPELFENAFNPFSINFAVFMLGLLNIASYEEVDKRKWGP